MKKITINVRDGNTETIIRHATLVKLEIADDVTKIWYRDEGVTARPEDIKFVSGNVEDVNWAIEVDNFENNEYMPNATSTKLQQPFDWKFINTNTSDEDPCQACPNKDGPKDAMGNPTVGDSPCQWCRYYKWRITCNG